MCQYVNFTDKLDVETKYKYYQNEFMGFPGGSDVQVSACNAGDLGSIPRLGRSPGEGKGYPLQYSGLKTPWTKVRHDSNLHSLSFGNTLWPGPDYFTYIISFRF